ncbi:hypothetical protein HK104_006307 [Borealophlyctis nickersoniae]|nr:hypothetical protein HK104_006307 [Borealophlyctis nickersoniae]
MTFAYPRFGREMNLVDRAEFVHQQVYAPNCRAAMAEARGAPLGCEELENAKADLEKGVAKARSVIVIQGEKAALPERITGMKEEDFLKTVLEERSGSGRRLCNGVWSGSWIDPGADHMDVVVGDQLVEAVQLAIQTSKVEVDMEC